jgi:serine phosphatase RsbU (regulator of sigma subunit)
VSELFQVDAVPQELRGGPVTDGRGLDEASAPLVLGRAPTRRGPHLLTLAIVLLGATVTTLLTWATASADTSSDHRLLNLQVRQAASALGAAVGGIQTPLTAAFDSSAATHSTNAFQQIISPDVGPTGPFLSASLWQVSPGPPKPLIVVGAQPVLPSEPAGVAAFFGRVKAGGPLTVTSIIGGSTRRLGFAEIPAGQGDTVLVYAESPLPANKKAVIPKSSGFSDLDFALYLGHKVDPSTLLETTGPLVGYHARTSVPFGDGVLTLVGTTTTSLAGGLSANLPLIAALLGAILTLSAAVTSEYLIGRRRLAEILATENASLYLEQRTIAETLQHSLLPEKIPALDGLEIAVRYAPGVGGIEVGGDWYDVIPAGEGNAFFFVGDVSGRGLAAATTMGYLRHAIRAYVAQGGGPAVVLTKLGELVGRADDGHFATVLCGYIEVAQRSLTVASAGHFAPLIVDQDGARYMDIDVGPPIGVLPRPTPVETTITVSEGTSVLAFTDGLVERRGESLDVGLSRLKEAVAGHGRDVDGLLGQLLAELAPDGSDDDIAILGVRWQR